MGKIGITLVALRDPLLSLTRYRCSTKIKEAKIASWIGSASGWRDNVADSTAGMDDLNQAIGLNGISSR